MKFLMSKLIPFTYQRLAVIIIACAKDGDAAFVYVNSEDV